MEILRSVGISAAFKGFIIFYIYGFITTLFIAISYGLDADLPDSAIATVEGPISIYTFGWLSLFGLLSLSITTQLGVKRCDIQLNKPKSVFYFSLPICEAAIALGVVIGAALLGVATATHLLFISSLTDTVVYPVFYGLSAFMFIITYPVVYFTIALIDTNKIIFNGLNLTALIYLVFVILTLYYKLPFNGVLQVGLPALVLIIIYALFIYLKPAITNKVRL